MRKSFVRADDLARTFKLPRNVAREIVAEQTRQALLHSPFAWLLFVLMLSAAAWFAVSHLPVACYIMVGLGFAWFTTGRFLARDSILLGARRQSDRLTGVAS